MPSSTAAIIRDLNDERRAEREHHALQEQIIAAQQAALQELSTPLIPIIDGVVAIPLVGTIDSSGAQQVIETLLNSVAASRVTTVILDITGVPLVDTQVASALLRAAQAVSYLCRGDLNWNSSRSSADACRHRREHGRRYHAQHAPKWYYGSAEAAINTPEA